MAHTNLRASPLRSRPPLPATGPGRSAVVGSTEVVAATGEGGGATVVGVEVAVATVDSRAGPSRFVVCVSSEKSFSFCGKHKVS